jgi:hypothetical protein
MNKEHLLKQARRERDWEQYLFLHSKQDRLIALLDIADELSPTEYWRAVRFVWVYNEFLFSDIEIWRDIWASRSKFKRECMTEDERNKLRMMPDRIRVYRGITYQDDKGLSWTLNGDKAVYFAQRFPSDYCAVVHGEVKKKDVHAFFEHEDTNEAEILATKVKVLARVTGTRT